MHHALSLIHNRQQLTNMRTGLPLRIGDMVLIRPGRTCILEGTDSLGRVHVMDEGEHREYDPSVIGAEWRVMEVA